MSASPAPTHDESAQPELSHPVRFITSASLFDGHDAAINVMRRILQKSGAEVIHMGHNRSVAEIVDAAIEEDAQGIAISSYQGGHVEFFRYMVDLLRERGAAHIKVFGGGGGVITQAEIEELEAYGVAKIFSPEDGRAMGLQGMIDHMLVQTDFDPASAPGATPPTAEGIASGDRAQLARAITIAEQGRSSLLPLGDEPARSVPVVGITGTGGAGKSSLTDELVRRFLLDHPDKSIAVICVDPARRRSGGALLGDRIRMNSVSSSRAYMRSMSTRGSKGELAAATDEAIRICQHADFDLIVLETSGIGQGDTDVIDHCDVALYVMTSEFGAWSQLEKIDMLDYADLVAINKFEKGGSQDALRAVRKQIRRNRDISYDIPDEQVPVFGTIASQFNDEGVNALYSALVERVGLGVDQTATHWPSHGPVSHKRDTIIPPTRTRYLAEIAETCRHYRAEAEAQAAIASNLYRLEGAVQIVGDQGADALVQARDEAAQSLTPHSKKLVDGWEKLVHDYGKSIIQSRCEATRSRSRSRPRRSRAP